MVGKINLFTKDSVCFQNFSMDFPHFSMENIQILTSESPGNIANSRCVLEDTENPKKWLKKRGMNFFMPQRKILLLKRAIYLLTG